MASASPKFILASASPRRRDLLAQIGAIPDEIIAADIDETPYKEEMPREYALRMARKKAKAIADTMPAAFVLGADTVVACGRRILPKAESFETARECLTLLSGRTHRVYSAIALNCPSGQVSVRLVETRVKVRRLNEQDMTTYLGSEEWSGKAGGYAIQGLFARHIISISGSYSSVVGLPLYETTNLLKSTGRL